VWEPMRTRTVRTTPSWRPNHASQTPLRFGSGEAKLVHFGAHSSVGRAPARQAGGHWFEPSCAHRPANVCRDACPDLKAQPAAAELDVSSNGRSGNLTVRKKAA